MANSFIKDPSAKLDYEWDWSDWLAVGETIASYVLTVPTGLIQTAASNTGTSISVTLSGGTLGARYAVVCQITTSAGLIDQRTIYLTVEDR